MWRLSADVERRYVRTVLASESTAGTANVWMVLSGTPTIGVSALLGERLPEAVSTVVATR